MSAPKRVLVPLLIVAVLAGVGWIAWPHAGGTDGPLTLYGNVDVRLVDVAFRVEGRLSDLLVDEGDMVAEGQTLARVDTGYLEDALALAQARLEGQQAQVDKLVAGSRAEEIAQARAKVAERRAALVNARATHERQKELVRTDAASRQKLDDAKAALDQAEAQLKQAQEALDLAVNGTREEDLRAAHAQLKADRALLTLAERRLDDAVLKAPAAGTVQTRAREIGAVLMPGATVYTIALASPVWVRTYVAEPELGRAVPGAKVEVTTDAAADKVYHGQIGFVSPSAEFTPKAVETPDLRTSLVYRIRVVVDDPDDGLRQGMPVTVTVIE